MSQVWSPEPSPNGEEASLGTLVKQLSEQSTRLIRDELRLAQTEMAEKAKKAGKGAGWQRPPVWLPCSGSAR